MSRLNRKKLISLDDTCWHILETETSPRMQSVYVRNAIVHYSRWMQAGNEISLVKDGTLARRFDANNINMQIIELQDRLEAQTNRWNDAYVENIQLKKQLSKYQEKENPGLKKWWHFFFVGFRK